MAVEGWIELEQLRPALRAWVGRRCRDENDVEDVVQETFLRAARYRASLTDPANLRAWALRIAANVLADCIRKDWRLKRAAGDPEFLDVVDAGAGEGGAGEEPFVRVGGWSVDRDVALGQLAVVLGELKEDDRAVLSSYYDGAQSCRETAEECGIPPNLVKVRLFRARERVRRALRRRLALLAQGVAQRIGA